MDHMQQRIQELFSRLAGQGLSPARQRQVARAIVSAYYGPGTLSPNQASLGGSRGAAEHTLALLSSRRRQASSTPHLRQA